MHNYIIFLTTLIITGFVIPLHAETLLEIYRLAQQYDPQIKIATQERLASLEQLPQAHAPLLPQISLNGQVTEGWHSQDWIMNNTVENTSWGYAISLSYTLYRRQQQIQYEQVDDQVLQAQANYETALQNLIQRVADRYFSVLAANDNLKFARSAKEAFQSQLDQAKQRFEVGLIAITDVQEAQAGYDLAVADEILAQNQLDNSHESLREITGNYHRVLAVLNPDAPLLGPEPGDIAQWTKVALENNPQILAAQYAIEIALKEVEKQRAANLPTLDLVGQHSYTDVLRGEKNPPGSFTTDNSIGIQLNYNLYQGGAVRSRIREAKQRHLQSVAQLEQQRRTVQSQTRQAFLSLLSNISRVKALKQALISTEVALNAVKTGFELGTRTSVDVVNAQRDLLQAQRNYSNARYDYVLSTLKLKQAAGLITEGDLIAIDTWLSQHTFELEPVPLELPVNALTLETSPDNEEVQSEIEE